MCMDMHTYILERGKGTSVELARLIGVSPVLVSQWRKGRRPVPAERCPAIERATKGAVRCEDLRPDVDWGYLRGTAGEPAPPDPETGERGAA